MLSFKAEKVTLREDSANRNLKVAKKTKYINLFLGKYLRVGPESSEIAHASNAYKHCRLLVVWRGRNH